MRKFCGFLSIIILMCCLGSCAKSTEAQWQEQYDLGVRYLSEGNYEEAIIAFTAAIEIDPVRAEAYIGLADVYTELGDREKAREVLEQGYRETSDCSLQDKLSNMYLNKYGSTEFIYRNNFRDFDTLYTEEQQYIVSIIAMVEENNKEELIKLAENALDMSVATILGQYKVEISSGIISSDSTNDFFDAWIDIEIRPQSGIGYYCGVSVATDLSRFSVQEDAVRAEYYIYGYGQCEDWQWNGDIIGTDQRLVFLSDGTATYSEDNSVGQISNSLRTGTTTTQGIIYNITNDGEAVESIRSTKTEQYNDGQLVKETTEMYSSRNGSVSTYESDGNHRGTVDSAWTSHSYSLDGSSGKDGIWW